MGGRRDNSWAASSFAAQRRRQWADLPAKAGIERAWAETSPSVVVSTRIFAEFDQEQYATAVERIARERAGCKPNGGDVPEALQAAVRLRLNAGDAFASAIADAVSDARAAELRAASDGWPGTRGTVGNRCEVEPEPPRVRDFVPDNPTQAQACIDDPKTQQCAFLGPTKLELDRMADCGVVRFDAPGRDDTEALLRRLAEERAGRVEPPTDVASRSIDERFMRGVIALGDDFERAIAQRLGAPRARALRGADDGWPGLRLQTHNYCNGGAPQML